MQRSRRRSRSRSRELSRGNDRSCPLGQIYRRGYTRYRGNTKIQVPGNCITATSQSKLKRSDIDREYLAQREQIQKEARRRFSREMPKKCPPGTVLREGFYRRPTHRRAFRRSSGTEVPGTEVSGAWVPPTCVPSINVQKKKRLFALERGVLGRYGYEDVKHLSTSERHDALDRALADGIEPLPLLRRVNALYVLNKNKDPELAAKFRSDVGYIRSTPEYQNRPTARESSTGSRGSRRELGGSRRGSKNY